MRLLAKFSSLGWSCCNVLAPIEERPVLEASFEESFDVSTSYLSPGSAMTQCDLLKLHRCSGCCQGFKSSGPNKKSRHIVASCRGFRVRASAVVCVRCRTPRTILWPP